MPYIVMRRSDIPAGKLQVTDLRPNTSVKNGTLEPGLGETHYIRPKPVHVPVTTSGAGPIVTVRENAGLAAYLIDHVSNLAAGQALTAAQANAAAQTILSLATAGTALGVANVNAAIVAAGAGAGSGIGGGTSTATLAQVLAVVAGQSYVLPAGSQVQTAGNLFDTTVRGSFTAPVSYYSLTGEFLISNGEGNLSKMRSSSFMYLGVAGAAVVVYADDGSLMV